MDCRIGQNERCNKGGCCWSKVFGYDCSINPIIEAETESKKQPLVELVFAETKKGSRRGVIKPSIRNKIFQRSSGICYLCGEVLTIEEFTVDHVLPLSKGGTNRQKNLRATHEKCNYDKADKIIKKKRKR